MCIYIYTYICDDTGVHQVTWLGIPQPLQLFGPSLVILDRRAWVFSQCFDPGIEVNWDHHPIVPCRHSYRFRILWQVFLPSKKVFVLHADISWHLHSQDDVLPNGDLPMIFRCYVRFCLYKMKNHVKHEKNKNTEIYIYTGYASIRWKTWEGGTKASPEPESFCFRREMSW